MDLKQLAEDMLAVYEPAYLLINNKISHKSCRTNNSGHYIVANPKDVAKRRKRNKNKKTHRKK